VKAEDQLSALSHLDELFGQHAIEYWLFGGWAVDFHAGKVTRPHDDLDLACRRARSGSAPLDRMKLTPHGCVLRSSAVRGDLVERSLIRGTALTVSINERFSGQSGFM
jgi:hypothetical protein